MTSCARSLRICVSSNRDKPAAIIGSSAVTMMRLSREAAGRAWSTTGSPFAASLNLVYHEAMPNIAWIDEKHATGGLGEIYRAYLAEHPDRKSVPDILKCFSQRPDFLKSVIDFSYPLHFADGHLTRRTKEMIATLVSGLNQCPY